MGGGGHLQSNGWGGNPQGCICIEKKNSLNRNPKSYLKWRKKRKILKIYFFLENPWFFHLLTFNVHFFAPLRCNLQSFCLNHCVYVYEGEGGLLLLISKIIIGMLRIIFTEVILKKLKNWKLVQSFRFSYIYLSSWTFVLFIYLKITKNLFFFAWMQPSVLSPQQLSWKWSSNYLNVS